MLSIIPFTLLIKQLILIYLSVFSPASADKNQSNPAYKNENTVTVTSSNSIAKINTEEMNYLLGKFDHKKDKDFVLVDSRFSSKVIYLRKEVYLKFKEMYEAAQKEGIKLTIISGTRNFDDQKRIWENKWIKFSSLGDSISIMKKILLYSSMPSTSRHHWGTDMDLISLESPYFENGQGLKEYKWLVEHAGKFGFCQVYDDKKETKRSGYELEKWHWSYMPLSSIYLKKYNELVNYSNINGFSGSKLAKKINVIEDFVNGINKKCE